MSSIVKLGYVAHPVGPDGPTRTANLMRAQMWFAWLLVAYPNIAFSMNWHHYCVALTEEFRERGMRDNIVQLSRCDQIYLVGGTLSPGMSYELTIAQGYGHDVIDLLYLGATPPWSTRV